MIARFKKNSYRLSPLAIILIIILGCASVPEAKRKNGSAAALGAKGAPYGKREVTVRKVWDGWGTPSPDGRYLSFCNWDYGDLAVHDLTTGEDRDVTDGGKDWDNRVYWASEFVWSPDGKQIAYSWLSYPNTGKPHELRTIGLDGSEPRVLCRIESRLRANINPRAWSQDGKFILADLRKPDGLNEIVLVSVADGSVRVLKSLTRLYRRNYMSLSPDGRYVVYAPMVEEDERKRDIFLLATDGSGKEVPLTEHPANDYAPVWAPDGKTIVFVSDRSGNYDAWLIHVADGKPVGEPRLVKRDIGPMYPLGFTREGSLYYSLQGSSTDVYIASIDPATGKLLAPPAKAIRSFEGFNSEPAWSPDGKSLAYVSSRRSPGSSSRRKLLVIRSEETGQERELHPAARLQRLRWSPDGRSILCGRGLQLINVKTGDVTRLVQFDPADNAAVGRAEWSRDGKAVFYILHAEGEPLRIMAHELETGKAMELRREDTGGRSLDVSPDGRQLVFERNDGGGLTVMAVEGGELRELLGPQDTENIKGGTWTPDGRYVLFVRRGNPNELWRVPTEGGEPQKLLEMDGLHSISVHPDGWRIAFASESGGREIWAMENFLPESTAGD